MLVLFVELWNKCDKQSRMFADHFTVSDREFNAIVILLWNFMCMPLLEQNIMCMCAMKAVVDACMYPLIWDYMTWAA